MKNAPLRFLCILSCSLAAPALHAELKLPGVISSHMVLQQKQTNPIWGWDTPGTKVRVEFSGQTKEAEAGADGKWTVKLDPLPANANPEHLIVTAGTQKVDLEDVLVGEVWICSGQSNMGFRLQEDWNGDLESIASHYPNLRLLKVPLAGTQELLTDFKRKTAWTEANPETSKGFSAVGFLFGRYIHQVIGVPVGLIDNAWGGSAAEAWVRRESLEKDARFTPMMEQTVKNEAYSASDKAKEDDALAKEKHKLAVEKAKAEGKPIPREPRPAAEWLNSQYRPGNLFAGTLHPILGYGIRGVVWYQGEHNSGRASEYRTLFPFMIEQWRKEWNQGDFSFYWCQLADFQPEASAPGESAWAELREAQTRTLSLPNTGQAVITDLGEGKDIHPKNKHDVAARLVRWALAKDYGIKIAYRSPEFKSLEIQDNKAIVSIECFGSALRPFDVEEAVGFAVCGEDRTWHWAKGKVLGKDKVELTCANVAKPVAVRYAWANNPVCNLTNTEGLPLTSFRTDDFDMITKDKTMPALSK
ncbi:MAG: sialate O-acetylesterase [Verrucomicrobiota bacterium]